LEDEDALVRFGVANERIVMVAQLQIPFDTRLHPTGPMLAHTELPFALAIVHLEHGIRPVRPRQSVHAQVHPT
jgi:hypothetical protein